MSKSIEQLVAEEMNKVMMYGMDEQGKLTEPDEQIDLEMTDKNKVELFGLEKPLEYSVNSFGHQSLSPVGFRKDITDRASL